MPSGVQSGALGAVVDRQTTKAQFGSRGDAPRGRSPRAARRKRRRRRPATRTWVHSSGAWIGAGCVRRVGCWVLGYGGWREPDLVAFRGRAADADGPRRFLRKVLFMDFTPAPRLPVL